MSKPDEKQQVPESMPVEKTHAFRAGYMSGYTQDNPHSDPSVAGYMDGYFEQREGAQAEESAGDDE